MCIKFSFSLSTLAAVVWFCAVPVDVFCIEPSDADVLARAVRLHANNIGKIRTWQGSVSCEVFAGGASPADGDIVFTGSAIYKSEISFCADVVSGSSLCVCRVLECSDKNLHDEICTLFVDGLSYEISRYINAESVPEFHSYESQLAMKRVAANEVGRLLLSHFLPMERCDFNGLVINSLDVYIEIAKQVGTNKANRSCATIDQQDGVLTINSTIEKSLNRYSVDMVHGGMPIEFIAVNTEDGSGVHWKCRLQKHEDIWIPQEILLIHDLSDSSREWCRYTWKENAINAPIPSDRFTLASLGIHRGTRVYDYRTGIASVISDDQYPPLPNQVVTYSRPSITGYVVGSILMLVGTFLVLLAIFRMYVIWTSNRKS